MTDKDEAHLSKAVRDYLNRMARENRLKSISGAMKFEFIDSFVDVAEEKRKIYIEVKTDHLGFTQLLHALARKGMRDAILIGVANRAKVLLYRPPPFDRMLAFAKSFDPKLMFTPSQVDKPELNEQAEKLLGSPEEEIPLRLEGEGTKFITADSLGDLWDENRTKLLSKYRINPGYLVKWLNGAYENRQNIVVNKEGWLVNMDRVGDNVFTNEDVDDKRQRDLSEFLGHQAPKHKPIMDEADKMVFRLLRVRHEDVQDVLHEADTHLPRAIRRQGGKFWTEDEVGILLSNRLLETAKPIFVVEPCSGGGSLLGGKKWKDSGTPSIVEQVKGVMNDKDRDAVDSCKKIYDGYGWEFTTFNIVTTGTDVLLKGWHVPEKGTLLLYTNPPFGTSSTNRLVSKKGEIDETHRSRTVEVEYGDIGNKYGSGDLIFPIVGRLIEIAKKRRDCYLAFFSPMGLFCGRERYNNLLLALLKDFQFMFGYTFAGAFFHNIAKIKPIAFSLWKYAKGANTILESLEFEFIGKDEPNKTVTLKPMVLLKDGWRYRDGSKYVKTKTVSPLGVYRADTFNNPTPKLFVLGIKDGSGAEVSPDNVKKSVDIANVPDELFYALWSVTTGAHGIWRRYPIYFDNAYVHLPDTSKQETLEILAYATLRFVLINYGNPQIGFFGGDRVFRFGNDRLTKGAEYLLKTFGGSPVYGGKTIKDVFELLRKEPDKIDLMKCRVSIKEEIGKRLEAIHYWDYVPIPMSPKTGEKERTENHLT